VRGGGYFRGPFFGSEKTVLAPLPQLQLFYQQSSNYVFGLSLLP